MRMLCGLALVLAIGGCGREGENASEAEVRDAVAAAPKLRPGLWRVQMKVDELQMPGAPPELQAAMKNAMSAGSDIQHCLTPAEAERPPAEIFAGKSDDCRYTRFSADGGKLSGEMQCASGEGNAATITLDGDISPTRYSSRVDMVATENGRQAMTMRATGSGERIGECPAS